MSSWDKMRSSVVDGFAAAAQRTEELTRLGVGHYDRFGLTRQLERALAKLGAETYKVLQEGHVASLAGNEHIQECVSRIQSLKVAIEAKEKQINELRRKPPTGPDPEPAAETIDSQ